MLTRQEKESCNLQRNNQRGEAELTSRRTGVYKIKQTCTVQTQRYKSPSSRGRCVTEEQESMSRETLTTVRIIRTRYGEATGNERAADSWLPR